MVALTDQERAILDFEAKWWRYPGAKESAIRDDLGLGGTHYYQQLAALIQRPEALAYAPTVVNRTRRRIVANQGARDPRRLGLA